MRIAINTRFLLQGKLEGIGWFTYEIVKRMVEVHPEHEFIFFFDRPYHPDFVFGQNVTPVVLQPPARHPILFLIWFEWSVRRALRKHKADVFVSTDGMLSLFSKTPTLLVIHDLAFKHYPEHLPFKFRFFLNYFTPKYARKAKHVVAVSSYTKQDIQESYGVEEKNISVVYNGSNEKYQPLLFDEKQQIKEQYSKGCEYFVFAGALHPRKTVERLMKAFAMFKRKQRSNMKLLVIGRFAWKSEGIRNEMTTNAFHEDILHYDYMLVDELSKVIGAAYAMVYVSLFEGFGIPALEALSCHVPLIASTTTSIPEVAGDAAIYVNPENVEEIAQSMSTLYKDEHLRTTLVHKTKAQAAKFSWNQSSLRFFEVIEKYFVSDSAQIK